MSSYLSPNDLQMRTAILAIMQLAIWDKVDRTWEVTLPIKSDIQVPILRQENVYDIAHEVKTFADQNGIAYTTLGHINKDGNDYFHIHGAKLT